MAGLPEGVAFDELHRRIYWVESRYSGARIMSASPTGRDERSSAPRRSAFRGIALDAAAGKLYWTSSNLAEGAKIRRANLDGSNVETLVDLGTAGSNPRGIALDPAGEKGVLGGPGARPRAAREPRRLGGRDDRLRDRVRHRARPGGEPGLLVELPRGEHFALRARGRPSGRVEGRPPEPDVPRLRRRRLDAVLARSRSQRAEAAARDDHRPQPTGGSPAADDRDLRRSRLLAAGDQSTPRATRA